jgi:glycosyltransferase involved in cell wall biosynthesis
VRVGIEIRAMNEPHAGGIIQHLDGIFAELCRSAIQDEFYFFGTKHNQNIFPHISGNVRRYSLEKNKYWAKLDKALLKKQIDVLFRCYPVSDSLSFPLRKQVVFVPDLQHEVFPQFFSEPHLAARRQNFSRLIQASGAVGTNSHHARTMIRDHHGTAFDDVFLMPPGSQFALATTDLSNVALRLKVKSLRPFFYFPAKLWPHKNHAILLQAFALFRSSSPAHERFSLVLTGDPTGWYAFEAAYDTSRVSHLGYIARKSMPLLYRNASALVFPSLFEGFGMPVLEAFRFECPVVCSRSASLPEVAGDAAILIDPKSPAELAQAMAKIVDEEHLRRSLIDLGRNRCEAYSWQASAKALRDALERVCQRHAR